MSEADTPLDESAALQWAIETFENGRVKDVDQAKRLREYNISLLRHHSKYVVKSIQRGDTQSIVVPESLETAHRMDHDELLDLIGGTRKDGEMHEYLLAVAAALIDNGDSLPAPLNEFVVEFLRNPKMPRRRGRKRSTLLMRDQFIAFVVASICVRWDFPPTRNEATETASAVSIAQRALGEIGIHLTEAAITKIWDKSGSWKEIARIE